MKWTAVLLCGKNNEAADLSNVHRFKQSGELVDFTLKRPVGKSREAWILWGEQHPELKKFAERWATQTEARMTARAPSAVWLFRDALEAVGRGDLSDDDMNKVVQALAVSWQYGRTLRKWWALHHEDLVDRD